MSRADWIDLLRAAGVDHPVAVLMAMEEAWRKSLLPEGRR